MSMFNQRVLTGIIYDSTPLGPGGRMDAIKALRGAVGLTLKQSKEAVLRLEKRQTRGELVYVYGDNQNSIDLSLNMLRSAGFIFHSVH